MPPEWQAAPVSTFLSVASALLLGIVLFVAPWTTWWEANGLLQAYPLLHDVALNPYVRGAVSGLGLVNLMLAVLEVHAYFSRTSERGRP
jgi:hypothetical protein